MLPNPLAAVIFDMDGLLLDTEKMWQAAIAEACAGQGFTMVDHVHSSLVGAPKDLGDARLLAHFGAGFDLEAYHRDGSRHFQALAETRIDLRPGARGLLELLRARGTPAAVATSTARPAAERHLAHAGVIDFFAAVVTRTDVTHGKPHPESFLKAAAALGVQPCHCLALEDSHNGVRAAAAAGMATIMIPDMLPATDEMRTLCAGILPSLSNVAAMIDAG